MRVTAGDHSWFGRVVLDAPGVLHTVVRDGDNLFVGLAEDPPLGPLPPPPRNVVAIQTVAGGLRLTVAPGATSRDSRIGSRIVIDIEDSGSRRPSPRASPSRATADDTPKPGALPGIADIVTPAASATLRTNAVEATGAPAGGQPRHTVAAVPVQLLATPIIAADGLARPARDDAARDDAATDNRKAGAAADNREPDSRAGQETAAHVKHRPSSVPEPRTLAEAAATGGESSASGPDPTPADDTVTRPESPAPPEPIQVWPMTRASPASGPVALVATRSRAPGGLTGSAVQVPFAEGVGAAMFSRGSRTFVVFDERRPIDLAALRDDPVFGSAVVTVYPAATMIRLVTPDGQSAMLSRARAAWLVSVVSGFPRPAALTPVTAKGMMTFGADAPGQVVAIADPDTGGSLLAGTQRKPGQAVLTEQRTPEFTLPVTGQGILIDPLSDGIGLRAIQAGFVLFGPRDGLALSPPSSMTETLLEAAGLTRRFGFTGQTTDALALRAKQRAVAAAVAPPLARGPKRHALAESLLGLGLGAEAQSLLRAIAQDDPREAASPDTKGLAAIAALLAGRPGEAGGLLDPRLTGTDEVALWRSIRMAMIDEGAPAAAAVLATTAPLLFAYPAELGARVLPLAIETMIRGGEAEPASRLLARLEPSAPHLGYARALLKQAQGDNAGALKLLDEETNARSSLDHARAGIKAIELRLAMGEIDAARAADALEKRLFAWRGDERDLALRRRIAELRRQTGAWRAAFAMLRAVRADFPAHAAEIEQQLKDTFAAMPLDPSIDTMPPLELVALLGDNAELMADGPDGEPMRLRLAEKLMALDLPRRADALLTTLLRAAPIGPARAGFGATLAALRLREGDGDGALLALRESGSPEMSDPVRERRALLTARVRAKQGDIGGAMGALSGIETQEAEETRAAIMEQAKDWPAARDALTVLVARMVPDSGPLDDVQRRLMLRLATAAAHASDDAMLASLREKTQARIGTGPLADMFRLLTEAPVRGTADLSRARAEMGLARAITGDMAPGKPSPGARR